MSYYDMFLHDDMILRPEFVLTFIKYICLFHILFSSKKQFDDCIPNTLTKNPF